MPTCPNCRRLHAASSAYVGDEGGLGSAHSGAVCYVAIDGHDAYCADLAADLARKADAELLAAARCFPPGLLARVAHVLTVGGKARGVGPIESGDGQTVRDHLEHAEQHVDRAIGALDLSMDRRDPDTGETDEIHAIARLCLVAGMAAVGV